MLARTFKPFSAPLLAVLEPDARVQGIPEAVIQELWALQDFDERHLKTTTGESLSIHNPGALNTDSGPDFSGAHIQMSSEDSPSGFLAWTGDIEIHRTSGEWLLHRHHEDSRYNRVVLHVVLLEDRHTGTLRRADGTRLPELVLYPRLTESLRGLLHRFYTQPKSDFYCENHWADISDDVRETWLECLGHARLLSKSTQLKRDGLGLNELLYRSTMRALGYAKNADAMNELARRVPLESLRSLNSQTDREALLFGTAGLLPELSDMMQTDRHSIDYAMGLRDRFDRLHLQLDVQPMRRVQWQYFRLRPANFPTRRIAQAAALFGSEFARNPLKMVTDCLRDSNPTRSLRRMLRQAEPSPFWLDHVRFEQRTTPGGALIGRSRADRIIVDAFAPVLLGHARSRSNSILEKQIVGMLNDLPAVSDEVTRKYEHTDTSITTALKTHGLHELDRSWCSKGRCMSCEIGKAIRSA